MAVKYDRECSDVDTSKSHLYILAVRDRPESCQSAPYCPSFSFGQSEVSLANSYSMDTSSIASLSNSNEINFPVADCSVAKEEWS